MKKIILLGLIAGLAMLVSSVVLSFLFNIIFPGLSIEYQTSGLFRMWSDPLMYLMFLHPFVLGLMLSLSWQKIKNDFKSSLIFGLGFWFVTSIPGMLISYSSFPISFLMILSWSISGLIQILIGSLILGSLNKKGDGYD